MPDPVRLALIGEGAIADIHMQSLAALEGVKVPLLVCGNADQGRIFARQWDISNVTTRFEDALGPGIDGLVIASPSGLHAEQALAASAAGKHALIEIPLGLTLNACQAVVDAASSKTIMMACHTRRFSPAHRWVKAQMDAGAFALQHLVAETFFFRRENLNMAGEPRTWVDSLLWHHAAHTIDLFIWLTGDTAPKAIAQCGPNRPDLGIPMDMTIGLKAASGALLTLSLSFNNRGPFGGFYRYIGDSGTYHVFRDELRGHDNTPIPLEGAAFLDQDAAFVSSIRGDAPAHPTPYDVLPAMRVIAGIQEQLAP